ncbi:RDD family protein [Mesorhizobium comanense]|uniref:RDD family protein n=1 Tax=Mesorhizobium comanense TaxID=2502215 RepID=UPI0010F4A789|nr:RDD family protein [Mesorhizobium comanense]
MTEEGGEPAVTWPRPGGLWRRLLASLIDYLVVFVALYALVAALFLMTDGAVKGSFWLNWRTCQSASLRGTDDPVLSRYDWQVCATSFFGLPVARWAAGTSTDPQSKAATTLSIDLDSKGNFRTAALDLGFLQVLVLAAYLLLMEGAFSRSLGKGVLALFVHDESDWHREGLGLRKAVRRQVVKFLGYLPATLVGAFFAFQAWKTAPATLLDYSRLEIAVAFIAAALAFLWSCWVALSIAFGNEPIHDRVAGTTVRVLETDQ